MTVAQCRTPAPAAGRAGARGPLDVFFGPETVAVFGASRAAEIAVRDPNSDGLLVILAPQASIDPVETGAALRPVVRMSGKPVLASWLWGAASPASLAVLSRAGIPAFACPNAAVRAFVRLSRREPSSHEEWEPIRKAR